uniref:25S rRNA (uridine-N(3))-methyltransferase BMT5-like domain-containing protein n=1 Tax=Oncorhynchus tshawytscha TaxID=74940 RepID=A0AAZ3QFQ2_ONCTS
MTSSEGGEAVLLVGEGTSFSAALSRIVATETNDITSGTDDITRETDNIAGGRGLRITATCLQTKEEALRHHGSAHNIHTITHSGSSVLFEVDCTRLSECVCLRGRQFDRCCSNTFSSVCVCSCVGVLKEEGEVLVSLCNGQGGTPADRPMREWHNSWQVVAMAAEAGLILNEVRSFDGEKPDSYQSTGYRSQDKGFHAEQGVTHVFSRSVACSAPQRKDMKQHILGGRPLTYHIPAELSHYIHRGFLSNSNHPVRLVQDFLVQALEREWPVSMVTEHLPLLIHSSPQRLNACCPEIQDTHTHCEGEECVGEGEECVGVGGYVLRPSLLPQVEILREEREHREREEVLHGVSGLVFQRVHISPWSPPAFHELLLWGAWPKASQSIPDLGRSLERLLTPYGLSLAEEQGSLWLAAEPMGRLGRLWADDLTDGVSVCLNLDLLASLVYSLPDWRLLWSPDPRFLNHFLLRPLPEQPFHPFSLFPQSFVYDISFWAGPDWQEAAFHALVREASREMVENVTLIDTYTPNTQTDTHPDVTHTYTTNTLTDTHPDYTFA